MWRPFVFVRAFLRRLFGFPPLQASRIARGTGRPDQMLDVLIVDIRVDERTRFGTLDHFVADKPVEVEL